MIQYREIHTLLSCGQRTAGVLVQQCPFTARRKRVNTKKQRSRFSYYNDYYYVGTTRVSWYVCMEWAELIMSFCTFVAGDHVVACGAV